jgi:CheY-like chemotaxis protein
VLVAEDNQVTLEVLSELLEAGGYRVLVAQEGRETVTTLIARGEDVDLANLDVAMPQMDGLDPREPGIRSIHTRSLVRA